ncbi:hypothetical protein HELRODRAFT_158584 [Helobdella robusta]|uniref:Uncharacterized protein n=1 Tax=Helobdella robusta TaxID=6412 RepID=T1EMZ4_HELRO|nr:hypothetical protein HELRODRAFT_158584 [Helobdella robusta]ESO12139.1 hypothetical protein HELRODRAFT_158584 [Helobdella robusta]
MPHECFSQQSKVSSDYQDYLTFDVHLYFFQLFTDCVELIRLIFQLEIYVMHFSTECLILKQRNCTLENIYLMVYLQCHIFKPNFAHGNKLRIIRADNYSKLIKPKVSQLDTCISKKLCHEMIKDYDMTLVFAVAVSNSPFSLDISFKLLVSLLLSCSEIELTIVKFCHTTLAASWMLPSDFLVRDLTSFLQVKTSSEQLRYKDHSKKHLTPDLHNRKKHSTELNKRHSSSASADKSLKKIDRKESIASTSSRKLQSTSKQSSLTSIILADAEKLVLESVAELKKNNVKKEHGEEVFLVPESHMNMATVYGQKNEVRCICGDNYDERKLNDVRKRQQEVIGGTHGTEDLNADNDEELAAIEQNVTKELEGHALSETVQSIDQELHDREVTVISIYSDKLPTESKPDKKIDEDDDDDDDSDVKSEAGPSNDYVKLRDESPIGWFAEREAGDVSHGGTDSSYTDISTGSDDVSQSDADNSWDFDRLLDEYNYLIMEEEELLAIGQLMRGGEIG